MNRTTPRKHRLCDPLDQPSTAALAGAPGIAEIIARRADEATLREVARTLLNYASFLRQQGSRELYARLSARAAELLEAARDRQRARC